MQTYLLYRTLSGSIDGSTVSIRMYRIHLKTNQTYTDNRYRDIKKSDPESSVVISQGHEDETQIRIKIQFGSSCWRLGHPDWDSKIQCRSMYTA